MLPLIAVVIFIIAIIILFKSSESVIRSSIKISEYLGISQLAIGFILIAVATSFPDLMVSIIASLTAKPSMAVGDALGSSIANIALVLGVAALIRKVNVKREQTLEGAELLLLISLVPLVLLARGALSYAEGLLLLIIFAMYVFFVFKKKFTLSIQNGLKKKDLYKTMLLFILGIAIIIASAHFVVSSATELTQFLGMSDALIGITLIAFGTTLPELAIEFTAIRRGYIALAIGDILGSCVVNLTLVLGAAIIVSPIAINFALFPIPIIFLVIVNSFLFYSLIRYEGINSTSGLIFIILYIVFLMLMFTTGI